MKVTRTIFIFCDKIQTILKIAINTIVTSLSSWRIELPIYIKHKSSNYPKLITTSIAPWNTAVTGTDALRLLQIKSLLSLGALWQAYRKSLSTSSQDLYLLVYVCQSRKQDVENDFCLNWNFNMRSITTNLFCSRTARPVFSTSERLWIQSSCLQHAKVTLYQHHRLLPTNL